MKQLRHFFLLTLVLLGSRAYSQVTYIRTVVHVLYTDAGSNLSDAEVRAVVDSVNKAFAKELDPTFVRATPIFDTLWAKVDIQFCLADTDPDGNPTTGITHTLIEDKLSGGPGLPLDFIITWDQSAYLNIYLAPTMPEPGTSFVMGGYAVMPDPGMGILYPSVVVASNVYPRYLGGVLTHELGHVFGLDHSDAGTAADVPKGAFSPAVDMSYPLTCSAELQSMNSGSADGPFWESKVPAVDAPDMVENFMNLTFCCAYMFTKSQKVIMEAKADEYSGWYSSACSSGATAMEKQEVFKANVYPNPSEGEVELRFNLISSGKLTVKICNSLGQNVYQSEEDLMVGENRLHLNLRHLPKGTYWVWLSDAKQQHCSKALMIH